ncbi:MAG: transposase, partial [Nakamurella sp.]
GVYLNPPARAAVFSYDEKTQCQALDRTQPSLPLKSGRAGTMTHDYKRNGTIDLFAAMNIATGQVLTDLHKGHTGADVLRFFKQIDASVPRGLGVHVVLDNLSAHSTPEITKWLAHKRPPALAPSLHPDLQFLAQPHRTVVQGTHR